MTRRVKIIKHPTHSQGESEYGFLGRIKMMQEKETGKTKAEIHQPPTAPPTIAPILVLLKSVCVTIGGPVTTVPGMVVVNAAVVVHK